MKKLILFAVVALVVAVGTSAYAELKNVEVGGMLRVRYDRLGPLYFDDGHPGDDFASSTIRLNVTAEMTEGVLAFIELQEIDIWGDPDDMLVGFPGAYYGSYYDYGIYGEMASTSLVGVPPSLSDADGFSLYQGYILIQDVAGYEGISVKIGRQELAYGTEFILGNNDFGPGLSYDAAAVIWAQDDVRVDLFAAKLAEGRTRFGAEDDADVDLYGIYSTYLGMEDIVVDGYFVFLRAADLQGFNWQLPIPEGAGMDDDPIQLYTIGGRIGGMYDAVDYNLEGAFQWGDNGWNGDYEGWALDAGSGYTFDVDMNPRLGFNYTFSSGDNDENDDNIETFLAPFADNYHRYGYMDLFGLGNLNVFKVSGTADPTEKIGVGLHVLHFLAVEHEDEVAPFGGAGEYTARHDTIGTELDLVADYAYSEDLSFEVAFAYFWAGPYIRDIPGFGGDDVYRIYVQGKLDF